MAKVFLCLLLFLYVQEVIKVEGKDKISSDLTGLYEIIPDGWDCAVLTEDLDRIERPHGLLVPAVIVEFLNRKEEISCNNKKINPCLKLYFYNISEKEHIKGIIKKESFYSWNIPVYFDETKSYIVVTSPSYINNGIFTEEAKKCYGPLEKSLKEYFCKLR
jgi:hypothetical protein